MTAEEFTAWYEAQSRVAPGTMRWLGRYPETCSCRAEECRGWIMGRQHEDALFEAEFLRRPA